MAKINEIYQGLIDYYKDQKYEKGVSAKDLSIYLKLDRTTISRYLNRLYKENLVEKTSSRPVLYRPLKESSYHDIYDDNKMGIITCSVFDRLIGSKESLAPSIQQAQAAILYPPNGLHSLILGKTGVGKTMFAELMHRFAIESKTMKEDAPWITFNCADYSNNPQLLLGQLFGVKKGAYTGADEDKKGLLEKADGGILFLDEIHRLPPEGQEMLFTFIDKGFFRRLGDTHELLYSKVLIISATTENPQSYLLKTFTRRIPMIINLPSLEERSLKERFDLMQSFFTEESKRIAKSIYVSENALISVLLYDCANNVGQLKSDIQLSCAKAFISYKSKNKEYVFITSKDLPQHVKKGMMKIKYLRDEVESIISLKEGTLRFDFDEINHSREDLIHNEKPNNFYSYIEECVLKLKSMGMDNEEINEVVNIDIEKYFKKYVGELTNRCRKEEILKVVGKEILDVTDEVLTIAAERLNRQYDDKIYYGLAMHINATVQRINKGNKIYNPKLNVIRANKPDAFITSMETAKIIESKLNVELPLDEIGYITIFLSSAIDEENDTEDKGRVGVLVIMHGRFTASSMVEVVNTLIGENHGVAVDMPLDMSPKEIYRQVKEKTIEIDNGNGVIFMLDMGSPANFGEMIHEETGIEIMTVEMASTLVVLEACRKAVMGHGLQQIYDDCTNTIGFSQNSKKRDIDINRDVHNKNVIVTTCFTGEGTAESIKNILCEKLDTKSIEIIVLDIIDKHKFLKEIELIQSKTKILAIVGTFKLTLEDIPFFTLREILMGEGIECLKRIIEVENMYYSISKDLKNHLHTIDSFLVIFHIRKLLERIQKKLDSIIDKDVLVGIIFHICFVIEKLKHGDMLSIYKDKQKIFSDYRMEYFMIKKEMKEIEDCFDVEMKEDEICYLTEMITENSRKSQK